LGQFAPDSRGESPPLGFLPAAQTDIGCFFQAGIIFVQPAKEFLGDEEDLSADDGPSKSNTRKNPRKSARIPEICGYFVFQALQARTMDRPLLANDTTVHLSDSTLVFVCEICG